MNTEQTAGSEIAMERAERGERAKALMPRFLQVLVSGVGCPNLLWAVCIWFGRWVLLSSFFSPGLSMLTFSSSFLVQLFGILPGLRCTINDPLKPKTPFLHQFKNAVLTTSQENANPSSPVPLLSQSGSY